MQFNEQELTNKKKQILTKALEMQGMPFTVKSLFHKIKVLKPLPEVFDCWPKLSITCIKPSSYKIRHLENNNNNNNS